MTNRNNRKTATKTMKENVIEIIKIVKTCITTFWFWLPLLFAIYMYIQIWMIFAVHPLTIFIFPTILSIYLIHEREKRLKIIYKIQKEDKTRKNK